MELVEEPILSCSVRKVGSSETMVDPDEIFATFENDVDLMLDSGSCGNALTTVIDLCDNDPIILREGKGDVSAFA